MFDLFNIASKEMFDSTFFPSKQSQFSENFKRKDSLNYRRPKTHQMWKTSDFLLFFLFSKENNFWFRPENNEPQQKHLKNVSSTKICFF
jgi:hypothetical protein